MSNTNFRAVSPVAAAVAAVLASSLSAGIAYAQEGERSAHALDEVVVTARKTDESLQETPVAVTAFTAESISDRQLQTVNDVARFTPGLVFDKAFGRTGDRPVIRGQGNVLANVQFGVEAGAAYFVDGIYYPGSVQTLDINEIERVEVIKGPQSALYGRNTYSGAINFVTRDPSNEFHAAAKVSYDKDEQNYSLRFEGPLVGDTLTGSLSLRKYDFAGQWKNTLSGEQIGQEGSEGITGVLQWKPTDDLRIKLRGVYNEDRDGTRPFMFQGSAFNNCYQGTRSLAYYASSYTNGVKNSNWNPYQYFCGEIQARPVSVNTTRPAPSVVVYPGIPDNALVGGPQTGAPAGSTRTYDLRPGVAFSGVSRDLTIFTAVADWDIYGSGYTLTVDGGIRKEDLLTGSDSDFTSVNTFSADPATGVESGGANTGLDTYRDYSVEVKLASPTDDNFRWMVGAFFYEQEQRFRDVNFRYPTGRSVPNSISDVYNRSIFGLVEGNLTDNVTLTVEGRYMEEVKSLFEYCTSVIAGVVPVCTARPGQDFIDAPGSQVAFDRSGKWTKFTPRATLKWQATDDVNVYFVYADGIKPGGFNGTGGLISTPQRPEYDQETSANFELGLKSTWLDGSLVVNVAAFRIKASDVQLTTPIVRADGSAVTSVASNQGEGETNGVEVETVWRLSEPVTARLTYALADSEFTKGCDDFQWTLTSGGGNNALRTANYNPLNPAAGGTNLNGVGSCDISGNQFPLSAKHTGSFALDYKTAIGQDYQFFAGADVSYTGKRPVQVHNLAYVPASMLIGARMGIAGDNWSVSLYGRNLGNDDSVAVATRWLQQPLVGFSTAALPGSSPLATSAQLAAAGLPAYPPASGSSTGLNSVASYALPRGFFAMLRRERQVGLEVSFKY